MKSKHSFAAFPFLLALVACAPISTPAPINTFTPTVTTTSTQVPPTSETHPTVVDTQANIQTGTPSVNENASEDCFLNIGFIPGKTGMNEVVSAWGNPSYKLSSLGGVEEDWQFNFVGIPRIFFKNQVIDTVTFSLRNCSLEKIVSKLGPPKQVEITVVISDAGPLYIFYIQKFHYTSLGFAYFHACDESQDCFSFHASDIVGGKEFYSKEKTVTDTTGFNMSSYVYHWHGFDVNVEQIENKRKDFVTIAPTP